jgi:cell division protein FtsQ
MRPTNAQKTAPVRRKNAVRGNLRRVTPQPGESAPVVVVPASTGGRRIVRRVLRFGVRLSIAGALAWGALWSARAAYAYATTSPRFEVRGLEYTPTAHVDDAKLRELMAIAPGTNILSLDLDQLAARIAVDPWVARAVVTRVLPDALRVEVEEHEPVAVLMAGGFHLLDREGLPFKALEPGERGQLPVVTGVDRSTLLTRPERARAQIARAIEVLEIYARKHRPRLGELHVDETGGVTLYTAELGSQLRIGRGAAEPALARYDALRVALGDEGDKLAVAHLDGSVGPREKDRVVASFFPTKDAPALLVEGEARAKAEADARGGAVQEGEAATAAAPKKNKSKRIPRYE